MKPLIVLFVVFALSIGIMWLAFASINYMLAGRIALAAMLVLTAFGHFKFVEGMEMMIPDFVPFKRFFVYSTGILEFLAALGLLFDSTFEITGLLLIIFFVLILPSNIQASMHHINIEKGTLDGPGLSYLWFRVPLQILFIGWTYFVTLR
ncbi:hypothetical protein QNI19_04770 [Cytophagaceae bacterium DM2B3-1]|uniref:DoxX family protein n=1 Tax=Xanthocytophaga flava TaxID=3048013 RepID=A0ABT7CGR9_9BACT|nr:hypothetical protein [Xanthocytophaga flavus]MDJ1492232.1 hypothetical protein [Xanthocytophaga flavus]